MFGDLIPNHVTSVRTSGYSASEIALPIVGTPYVGKVYPADTEITALGLEALHAPSATIDGLLAHPDAVFFVIGAAVADRAESPASRRLRSFFARFSA